MLKANVGQNKVKTKVSDLMAGDVAIIDYGCHMLVYVYKSGEHTLSMVSLDHKDKHWASTSNNDLSVIRVLKDGETIEVFGND